MFTTDTDYNGITRFAFWINPAGERPRQTRVTLAYSNIEGRQTVLCAPGHFRALEAHEVTPDNIVPFSWGHFTEAGTPSVWDAFRNGGALILDELDCRTVSVDDGIGTSYTLAPGTILNEA